MNLDTFIIQCLYDVTQLDYCADRTQRGQFAGNNRASSSTYPVSCTASILCINRRRFHLGKLRHSSHRRLQAIHRASGGVDIKDDRVEVVRSHHLVHRCLNLFVPQHAEHSHPASFPSDQRPCDLHNRCRSRSLCNRRQASLRLECRTLHRRLPPFRRPSLQKFCVLGCRCFTT